MEMITHHNGIPPGEETMAPVPVEMECIIMVMGEGVIKTVTGILPGILLQGMFICIKWLLPHLPLLAL